MKLCHCLSQKGSVVLCKEIYAMPPEEVANLKTWYSDGHPKSIQDPSVANAAEAKASKQVIIQNMLPTNVR